ncbi:YfhO family protein [Lacticaseibacillus saniviri]|uniref:YfhO family protein n=1 Tax=Lacticaseibacillus saniviri TaxID=931533 RepID=UPI0034E1BDE2
MLGYYIGCHVYPFGNSSLLTVDLGQQYIDFYSYFRQTILGHPDQFLYSFNKALGGDMLGVFAYYLMSPFNFILLFFPKSMLDTGIVALTLLKYGSAGLTMCYYLKSVASQVGGCPHCQSVMRYRGGCSPISSISCGSMPSFSYLWFAQRWTASIIIRCATACCWH